MIETLAEKMTTKFINSNIVKSEDREIYNYCFEITIFLGIGYLVLFFLSLIFNESLVSVIFLLSFLVFRKNCGGYHAKKYYIFVFF